MNQFLLASIISSIILLVCGIVLMQGDRSYNQVIFTLHKVAALSLVVLIGFRIKHLTDTGVLLNLQSVSLVLGIISVVGLFVSGALMSIIDKPMEILSFSQLVWIHRITTFSFAAAVIGIHI